MSATVRTASGSTYAPALKDSVKRFDYAEFAGIVIGGREIRQRQTASCRLSPTIRTLSCYIDDLYVYLRALSTESQEKRHA